MEKIKLHARVTREIEVTVTEANLILGLSRGSLDDNEIGEAKKIVKRFTTGIESGDYEAGYIPAAWIEADLNTQSTYYADVEL